MWEPKARRDVYMFGIHITYNLFTGQFKRGGQRFFFTAFLWLFLVYKWFLSDHMGSREYKNNHRELRHHFIRFHILVNTCWPFGQQQQHPLSPTKEKTKGGTLHFDFIEIWSSKLKNFISISYDDKHRSTTIIWILHIFIQFAPLYSKMDILNWI